MSHKRILLFLLLAFIGCKKEDAVVETSPCQSPYGTLRRREFIQDRAAVVIQISQTNGETSFQIVPAYGTGVDEANRTPWGGCNLGTVFRKDGLKVTVSGYFLTSDQLGTMNISPLPFEVTSMQVRN